ncbi:MAG: ribonuclease P protein component [Actinobacteria bacterium]|nr:MAG: ribonuclease P protein component [Actinomycetota bacterium]
MRTIRSSAEIDRLFREGTRATHPLLVVLVSPAPAACPGGRVAFVAGRKLGGAVARNRAKRVLREACRRAGGPWDGLDAVLIARAATGAASPADLDAALAGALRRVSGRGDAA